MVDPPSRRSAQDLPIDPAVWLLDYYRPIVDLLDQTDAYPEGAALVGTLPGTDIQIGVSRAIAEVVRGWRERPLARPRPRSTHDDTELEEARRPLAQQTDDKELRLVVEQLTVSAREMLEQEGAANDGLIVRSARG